MFGGRKRHDNSPSSELKDSISGWDGAMSRTRTAFGPFSFNALQQSGTNFSWNHFLNIVESIQAFFCA